MKQAFAIALVASALLAGALLWFGGGDDSTTTLPRSRGGGTDIFDPRTAAGESVFVPEMASTLLEGESEAVHWPAALFWCGSLEPGEDARTSIRQLRVLANRKPRTRADMARLVQPPAEFSPRALGTELERLVRNEHAGLLAEEAVLLGGHTLQSVRRMEMHGSALVARRVAGSDAREVVSSSDLALDFEKGELLHARTESAATLESPVFALKAEGLDLDARSGALALNRKVVGRMNQPLLDAASGLPFEFRAEGALKFTPAQAPAEQAWFRSGGLLECDGGVEASEGPSALRARTMALRFKGVPLALQHLLLQGQVEAQLPLFHARGEALTLDPVAATVEASGSPLALRWNDGRGTLRTLETDGAVTVGPPDAVGTRTLSAPGAARLLGPDLSLQARQTTVLLQPAADGPTAADKAANLVPRRIHAHAPVGRQGAFSFTAAELVVNRQQSGDTLRLEGEPRLILSLPHGAGSAAAWLGEAASAPLLLVIEAGDSIEVEADPLRQTSSRVLASGRVRLRVHARDEQGPVLTRVLCQTLELRLLERFTPDLSTAQHFRRNTELQTLVLRGEVALERGGWEARGDEVQIQFAARTASLRGAPALVRMKGADGSTQHCSAPSLRAELLARILRLDAAWSGSLQLPLLSRERSTRRVTTTVSAGTATLHFAAAAGTALEALQADGNVRLQQDQGGSAACGALLWQLQPARLAARGGVQLALSRTGAQAESVVAPSVDWLTDNLRAVGPVEASLAFPAVRLLPSPNATPATGLETMKLRAQGSLALHDDVLLLEGPVTASQGDVASGGMSLEAAKAVMFFDPAAKGAGLTRLVLDGAVRYTSAECRVRGELLRLDHPDRRLLLSGGPDGCTLSLPRSGLQDHVRPSFVVDFHDPRNPVVESVDRSLPREGR